MHMRGTIKLQMMRYSIFKEKNKLLSYANNYKGIWQVSIAFYELQFSIIILLMIK